MVRVKSVVWDHFKRDETDGHVTSPMGGKSRPAAYCSYCNLKYTFPNATKMMRHLLRCTQCPYNVKQELEQSGFGEYRADPQVPPPTGSHEDRMAISLFGGPVFSTIYQENDSPTPGTSALFTNSTLLAANSVNRTDKHDSQYDAEDNDEGSLEEERHSATHRALAKAIYCSNVPVTITENIYWQEMFRLLQPAYKLPTKDAIIGPLLDAEYSTTLERVSEEINKTKFAAMMVHGRSHHERTDTPESQVNIVITTPKPIFLGCVDVGQQVSPAEVAEVIMGIMDKVDPALVLLVVTDLSQNVRDSWKSITDRFPCTTVVGSPVEGLNEFLKCILALGSIQVMIRQAAKVHDYKNTSLSEQEQSQLNAMSTDGSCTCLQDGTVQTGSILALSALMNLKKGLQESVVSEAQNVHTETEEIILNGQFWDTVSFTMTLWRKVHLAMLKLEIESARLSDVPVEIMDISKFLQRDLNSSPLTSREKETIMTTFDDIRRSCCQDIHFAACLLDPRYRGSCLLEDAINDAIQYIVKLSTHVGQDVGRVVANLAEYRAKEGRPWSEPSVWDAAPHIAPATWWKGICDKQPLSAIAFGILNLPVTSVMTKINPGEQGEYLQRDRAQKVTFVRANNELSSHHSPPPYIVLQSDEYQ